MINKYFVIYGERNSGTNYLETILTGQSYHLSHNDSAFNTCVINSSIAEFHNNRYGHKHFFGFYDDLIKDTKNIVFIGIVRNPYDWIIGLHRAKHHIPPENHDINNLLTKEWYSIQHAKHHKDYGKELMGDRDFTSGDPYGPRTLLKRYENIFSMRSKKLRYLFETMPTIAKNYEFIKYEHLCNDPMNILMSWSQKYNLTLNSSFLKPIKKGPHIIPSDIKEIIDRGINWEIENMVGYFRK